MKLVLLCLTVVIATTAGLKRVRRQTSGCVDAFQNVPNPCQNGPNKSIFFPHPTDNTKFLRCDMFGRMYITQCPKDETYNIATTSCQAGNQATSSPVTKQPSGGNPCTPENIAKNRVYFPVSGDLFHFIECDLKGDATVLPCPSGLRWDQKVIACVYPPDHLNSPPTNVLNPTTPKVNVNNPCSTQAIAGGKFFFAASDPHKFIQCDPWGDVYINTCPGGLIWNNFLETCYSPYNNFNSSGGLATP